MTSWVRAGAMAVCVDDNWEDVWPDGYFDEVPGPPKDEVVTITAVDIVDGILCVKVTGWPFWWEASAFRPLSLAEQDALYFSSFLTHSSAPIRALEPACSS